MNKLLACFLSLVLVLYAATFVPAQMKSDPTGTWGGAMTTDVGPGGLEITLARDASGWTATMKFHLEGQEAAPAVRELKISGAEIAFAADLDRNVVTFAGKFAGDTLNGTLEAFQGDRKIGAGTFALTFGGKMPPLQQAPQAGGQMADPNFKAKVDRPAYKKGGPKVLFDEAHNNFHTAGGRYKPFADLITSDGFQVIPNKQIFSPASLKDYKILVISNALGAARMNDANAGNSAFTEEESDAVRDWVKSGGSLLLIADHAPMGSANESLGKRFGVEMSKMYTADEKNSTRIRKTPASSFIRAIRAGWPTIR